MLTETLGSCLSQHNVPFQVAKSIICALFVILSDGVASRYIVPFFANLPARISQRGENLSSIDLSDFDPLKISMNKLQQKMLLRIERVSKVGHPCGRTKVVSRSDNLVSPTTHFYLHDQLYKTAVTLSAK